MSDIKPEVSKKNKYWIEKHRYYELKHFCLQYTIWKKLYNSLEFISPNDITRIISKTNEFKSPTERYAIARQILSHRMELIENAAKSTDEELYNYILEGVTNGYTFDYLKLHKNIPCCREVYYNMYRKFFWILDSLRN